MEMITKETSIEDLVENYSFSVDYLAKNGIRCIVCGEPIWGSLQEASEEKGFDAQAIEQFVADLNSLVEKAEDETPYTRKIDVQKM